MKFAYFGNSRFSVLVLDRLEKEGMLPDLVITTPDKPRGRKMTVTPTEVKSWADRKKIPVETPAKLDREFMTSLAGKIGEIGIEVFVVASYGKIIPEELLLLPEYKTLNIHGSLLPKYRGASPIQTAILSDDRKTGVTIMRIDKEMDHGPIVCQEHFDIQEWPTYEKMEEIIADSGAKLLVKALHSLENGTYAEKEQAHREATYTGKISKEDGEIDLSGDERANFLRIQAFHAWPQAFFWHENKGKKIRVKVTAASFTDGKLVIERVIPEGKKEMSYADFQKYYY